MRAVIYDELVDPVSLTNLSLTCHALFTSISPHLKINKNIKFKSDPKLSKMQKRWKIGKYSRAEYIALCGSFPSTSRVLEEFFVNSQYKSQYKLIDMIFDYIRGVCKYGNIAIFDEILATCSSVVHMPLPIANPPFTSSLPFFEQIKSVIPFYLSSTYCSGDDNVFKGETNAAHFCKRRLYKLFAKFASEAGQLAILKRLPHPLLSANKPNDDAMNNVTTYDDNQVQEDFMVESSILSGDMATIKWCFENGLLGKEDEYHFDEDSIPSVFYNVCRNIANLPMYEYGSLSWKDAVEIAEKVDGFLESRIRGQVLQWVFYCSAGESYEIMNYLLDLSEKELDVGKEKRLHLNTKSIWEALRSAATRLRVENVQCLLRRFPHLVPMIDNATISFIIERTMSSHSEIYEKTGKDSDPAAVSAWLEKIEAMLTFLFGVEGIHISLDQLERGNYHSMGTLPAVIKLLNKFVPLTIRGVKATFDNGLPGLYVSTPEGKQRVFLKANVVLGSLHKDGLQGIIGLRGFQYAGDKSSSELPDENNNHYFVRKTFEPMLRLIEVFLWALPDVKLDESFLLHALCAIFKPFSTKLRTETEIEEAYSPYVLKKLLFEFLENEVHQPHLDRVFQRSKSLPYLLLRYPTCELAAYLRYKNVPMNKRVHYILTMRSKQPHAPFSEQYSEVLKVLTA